MHKQTYGHFTAEDAEAHDAALLATQTNLLGMIAKASSVSTIRTLAEAYALISGKLDSKPVEIKNS